MVRWGVVAVVYVLLVIAALAMEEYRGVCLRGDIYITDARLYTNATGCYLEVEFRVCNPSVVTAIVLAGSEEAADEANDGEQGFYSSGSRPDTFLKVLNVELERGTHRLTISVDKPTLCHSELAIEAVADRRGNLYLLLDVMPYAPVSLLGDVTYLSQPLVSVHREDVLVILRHKVHTGWHLEARMDYTAGGALSELVQSGFDRGKLRAVCEDAIRAADEAARGGRLRGLYTGGSELKRFYETGNVAIEVRITIEYSVVKGVIKSHKGIAEHYPNFTIVYEKEATVYCHQTGEHAVNETTRSIKVRSGNPWIPGQYYIVFRYQRIEGPPKRELKDNYDHKVISEVELRRLILEILRSR